MSSSSSPSAESNFLAQLEGPQLEQLQLEVQQQIKLVRGVFVELNRLLKAINLYGAEHQSVRQFRVRFFQSITQALEEWGGFTLDVQSYELSLAEQGFTLARVSGGAATALTDCWVVLSVPSRLDASAAP